MCGFLVSFCFFQGYSQSYFDIVSLSYTNSTSNEFEISNDKTTVKEYIFELNYPIVLNKKTILLTGLFANKTKLNLDAILPMSNLDVLGVNFGVNKTLNDTWSATLMGFSRLASDKLKFSKDNFQVGFLSLFTNKKRNNLKFRYGIYANTEKYGLLVVPIFGMYYLSNNKKFEVNFNLPIIADINYKLFNKAWLGMRFDGIGATYNLTDQNYSNTGAYVAKNSNELVSYFRYRLSKSLYINSKIGYAIGRNYKVFDANDKIDLALSSFYFGDQRIQLNERFKDGVVFKVELLYRFHFK